MSATSRNNARSGGRLPSSACIHRSMPPPAAAAAASTRFASYSSSFNARSSTFFHSQQQQIQQQPYRSTSPSRVRLVGSSQLTPSVRFSLDSRPTSPGRSIAYADRSAVKKPIAAPSRRRTCMCSPTNHPGSFRCSLHKGQNLSGRGSSAVSSPSNRLNMRRSAMTNSLVRIGTVEGDLVRRALSALIRPSSHQQRRRFDFQRRPSRLSVMSKAAEDL